MKSVTLTSALSIFLAAPSAWAADACSAAYEHAQELRADKDLLGAREQLLACSNPTCAEFIRKDCGQWLGEVEVSLPSVAIQAHDEHARPLTAVQTSVDGTVAAAALDGHALGLNPGKHHFEFQAAGFLPVERDLLLVEGQKNQLIEVAFQALPAAPLPAPVAPPSEPGPRVSPAAYALGALGVVGLASFAGFGLSGLGQEHTLRDSPCAGTRTCSDDQLSPIRHKYLIADISLGVGVVSLAAATYLFLSPSKPPATARGARRWEIGNGPGSLGASLSARY